MKNVITGTLLITFILLGSFQIKANDVFDTVYLCMRYRNANRGGAGLTGTSTDFERVFFLHEGKKKIFFGQPNNYFQNYNFRYIRLLLPKDSSVSAAIQIIRRPEARKEERTKLFDTSFNIKPVKERPPIIAFTHVIYSASRSFEFDFIKESSKGYKRVQKKLHEKRVIAEYDYNKRQVLYFQPSSKLFIE